ncbi:transposase [Magnetospirillum sulfuroxidans]|uniref:Transposase n=1 Tax=Magnetospirillum sulfuroxidans TaxID=611300 RepID=A0ABS5II02_9PROT|nr:transposase [Magnetospirillum sulfuroxidans]MBR9973906.1 transposase [Magnetospirillum sulfuroxidans]
MSGEKPSNAVGGDDVVALPSPPDLEVTARPRRRSFTAAYKAALLAELDGCQHSGEIGAVLRREGIYSSSVAKWRQQRRDGVLAAIKRGPPARMASAKPATDDETRALRRENAKLRRELEVAQLAIDIQKKVAALMEIGLTGSDGEP